MKHGKFRLFLYRASKSRRNTDMGGWKQIGMFQLTFCSLLLPILFDKHGGCYGKSLIAHRKTENPETFLTMQVSFKKTIMEYYLVLVTADPTTGCYSCNKRCFQSVI